MLSCICYVAKGTLLIVCRGQIHAAWQTSGAMYVHVNDRKQLEFLKCMVYTQFRLYPFS